jgi:hypothetical protein
MFRNTVGSLMIVFFDLATLVCDIPSFLYYFLFCFVDSPPNTVFATFLLLLLDIYCETRALVAKPSMGNGD